MLLFVAASYNKLLFWLLLSRVITSQGGAAFFFFRMHFSGEQVSLMPASYFFLFFFWSPSSKRQSSLLFFSEDKILRKRKGQRWTLFKSEHSMMKVRTDIMRTLPTLIYTCNPIGAVHVDVGTLFDSIAYLSTQFLTFIFFIIDAHSLARPVRCCRSIGLLVVSTNLTSSSQPRLTRCAVLVLTCSTWSALSRFILKTNSVPLL